MLKRIKDILICIALILVIIGELASLYKEIKEIFPLFDNIVKEFHEKVLKLKSVKETDLK